MDSVEYCYDGKFEGNILIIGQTGCRKTMFIQNISKNNLFGDLKETFWMTKISLSREKEQKNNGVLLKKNINFKYLQNLDDFSMELTFFQRKRDDENCNGGR